jgi:hypothetical protein
MMVLRMLAGFFVQKVLVDVLVVYNMKYSLLWVRSANRVLLMALQLPQQMHQTILYFQTLNFLRSNLNVK